MKRVIIQKRPYAIALGTLTLSMLMCGCATKLPDYHPGATVSTMQIGREGGIEIALDPFVEAQRTRRFFGINAAAKGIGIVFVRISNNTTNQTFLVEKKNFQLLLAGVSSGQNGDTKTIEQGQEAGSTLVLLGGYGVIGAVGVCMVAHATEVQRNFADKEMPDQTLAPGQNMEGFIYFWLAPKAGGWSHGATMKINLTETKSQEPTLMTILLSQ